MYREESSKYVIVQLDCTLTMIKIKIPMQGKGTLVPLTEVL